MGRGRTGPPFLHIRCITNKNLALFCGGAAFAVFSAAGLLDARQVLPAAAVLGLGAIFFGLKARLGRHPEENDTERFLVQQLLSRGFGGAFHLSTRKSRVERLPAATQFLVRFSADLTLTEPLYRVAHLSPEMTGRFTTRRISALCALARKMAEELGTEANGIITRLPADPYGSRFIEATSEQGRLFPLQGVARVKWSRQGWRYSLEAMSEGWDCLMRTGLPRGCHGRALVLNSTDVQIWLRDNLRAWKVFEEQLARLQLKAEEIRAQRARAACASFFAAVRAGTVFFGLGETLTRQHEPIASFLEFTSLDEAKASAEFLLRNDGGWAKARAFSGTVIGDSDGKTVILSAHTRAVDAQPGGGPLLQAGVAFDLEVRWNDGDRSALVCSGGDYVFRLELLAASDVLLRRAEVYPRESLVRAATATGTSYTGFVRSESGVTSVSLDFHLDEETQDLAAILAHAGGQARFSVEPVASRYEGETCDLLLVPFAGNAGIEEASPLASDSLALGPVKLKVLGRDLEGWTALSGTDAAVKLRRLNQAAA